MCICAAGVCRGYLCPHAHFSGVFIYSCVGIDSVRSIEMAVVGQSHRTAAVDTPFFVCRYLKTIFLALGISQIIIDRLYGKKQSTKY